jgi:hypothetical protein
MDQNDLSDLTKETLAYGVYQKSLEYYKKRWKWIAGIIGPVILILSFLGYNNLGNVQSKIEQFDSKIESLKNEVDSLINETQKSSKKIEQFNVTSDSVIASLLEQENDITKRMIFSIVEARTGVNRLRDSTQNALIEIDNIYNRLISVSDSMRLFLNTRSLSDSLINSRLLRLETGVDSLNYRRFFPIYLKTNTTTPLSKFKLIIHIDGTKKIKGESKGVRGLKITTENNYVYADKKDTLFLIGYDSVMINSHKIEGCTYSIKMKAIYIFEQFIEHGLVLFQLETNLISPKDSQEICPL